ncbi:hypothetical protein LTR08_003661 [Meristemomyces frigidus]|nr:hypothetical protein LTR08_003661 [Meristemomyces frigidus]
MAMLEISFTPTLQSAPGFTRPASSSDADSLHEAAVNSLALAFWNKQGSPPSSASVSSAGSELVFPDIGFEKLETMAYQNVVSLIEAAQALPNVQANAYIRAHMAAFEAASADNGAIGDLAGLTAHLLIRNERQWLGEE